MKIWLLSHLQSNVEEPGLSRYVHPKFQLPASCFRILLDGVISNALLQGFSSHIQVFVLHTPHGGFIDHVIHFRSDHTSHSSVHSTSPFPQNDH